MGIFFYTHRPTTSILFYLCLNYIKHGAVINSSMKKTENCGWHLLYWQMEFKRRCFCDTDRDKITCQVTVKTGNEVETITLAIILWPNLIYQI